MPLCVRPGSDKLFTYPVCRACKDKVPYDTVKVVQEMDPGYFYIPYVPMYVTPPVGGGKS